MCLETSTNIVFYNKNKHKTQKTNQTNNKQIKNKTKNNNNKKQILLLLLNCPSSTGGKEEGCGEPRPPALSPRSYLPLRGRRHASIAFLF